MRTPNKKKEEVKPYNIWTDPTAPGVSFEHAEFIKRLKDVHGIDPTTTKGTRSTVMHVDGDTWFSWEYEWEIGGKKFRQATRTNRTGMNREIWAGE